MKESISRRLVLKKALRGAVGLATLSFLGPALASCNRKVPLDGEPLAKQDEGKPCPGQEGLSDDQRALRANLKYIDSTPIPRRTCDNCKLYMYAKPNSLCGGCKILPGPIHPKGYCISWYARM